MSDWVFEHPEWLQGLWGLPLLVILYLLRRRVGQLLVPHLPLWERVLARERRHRPRFLRTLLSILMQMTIFAAALLLLASPVNVDQVEGRGHTVILLDRSLGTRIRVGSERSLADEVLALGEQLARQSLGQGTVSVGLLAGRELRALVPATRAPEDLDLVRSDLGVPAGARNWSQVKLVATTVAMDGPGRVVVVSPFLPPAEVGEELLAMEVTLVGTTPQPPNVGIIGVERSGGQIAVTVAGNGPARTLQLLHGTDDPVVRELDPDGGSQRILFDLPPTAGAEAELRLLPGDAFVEDDHVPLLIPERRRIKVLVVATGRTPYLDACLGASAVIDAARSGRIAPEAFTAPMPEYDVVVLVDGRRDTPLPAGRYLLLGGRLAGLPMEFQETESGAAQPVSVVKEDALVRALDLASWVVHSMDAITAGPGLQVVVEGSVGPLISRGEALGVRFVHLAVPPDPRRSTLPLMEAFPLFIQAALTELAGTVWPSVRLVDPAGGRLDLLAGEEPVLLGASGATLALEALEDGTGYRLPERVGRYLVGGPEPRRPLTIATLDHAGRPGPPLPPGATLPAFPPVERRQGAGVILLMVLGGLLLLEWLLYHLLLTD